VDSIGNNVKFPNIADDVYNIVSYGAKGDGVFDNTRAIQSAIDDAHRNNGGRVIVPPGVYLIGSIVLKSRVELHLEKGATLLGSTNRFDYTGFNRWLALILADGQTDIAITGRGTIDGQGRELALNTDALYHAGKIDDPNYSHRRHRPNEAQRPQIIEFVNCQRIRISGITIKNASCWVQTYSLCQDLSIDRIWVESDAFWNNDGMDIEDCQNVRITNCDVNAADDGICLKSESKDACNENIYIANCRVRSSASAVKLGTASYGGFRNVKIRNISVYDTYRSAIALESVDGGILEDIDIAGIFARNTGNAIFIRLGHRNVGGRVGTAKNICIKNVKAHVPFERPDAAYDLRGPALPFFHNPMPASITGIPGYLVENVTLEDIEISYPGRANKGMAYIPLCRLSAVPENESEYPEFTMFEELPAWGFYVRHVAGLEMRNICLRLADSDFRPAFVFDDVIDLEVDKVDLPVYLDQAQFVVKDVQRARFGSVDERMVEVFEDCSEPVIDAPSEE
jgi:hypothetical protein